MSEERSLRSPASVAHKASEGVARTAPNAPGHALDQMSIFPAAHHSHLVDAAPELARDDEATPTFTADAPFTGEEIPSEPGSTPPLRIQRAPDPDAPAASADVPPGPPNPNPTGPSAQPTGSTSFTVAPSVRPVSGKTLTEVWNALTNGGVREAASVLPKFDPQPKYEYDDQDRVSKVTVTVVEQKEMPTWQESAAQCPPILAEWNRYIGALDAHENHHVDIDRQHFANVHKQLVGKKRADAWKALDDEIDAADKENKTYDSTSKNGVNEGAVIKGSVQCAPEKIKSTATDPAADNPEVDSPEATVARMPDFIQRCAGPGACECDHCREEEERRRVKSSGSSIQKKLTVSQPGDPQEEEAERVADEVMRQSAPNPAVVNGRTTNSSALERCAACDNDDEDDDERHRDEREKLHRAPANADSVNRVQAQVTAVTQASGEALPPATRELMEPRFGFDFSRVRIHADQQAAASAKSVQARAYTMGTHVVFGAGQYSPETAVGQRLLAHELTHVIQQDGGAPRAVQRAPDPAQPAGTTSTDKSTTSSLGDIASELQLQLADKPGHREAILKNMLRAGKQGTELKTQYKEKSQNKDKDLIADLNPGTVSVGWSTADFIRAQRYLDYGELRTVDKIYIAAKGAGTDWPTIERMLPEVHKNYTAVEAAFSLDYSKDYSNKGRLPNNQQSYIAGLIDDEFPSGNDAPEAVKGKAVIAFGAPEPLDLIRAGTDGDTLLKPLQQARQALESTEALQKQYQARYPEKTLQGHIEKRLSGEDVTRARMILDGTFTARNRIKLAMGMGLSPDDKEIWAALEEASPAEINELRQEYKNKGAIYTMFKGGVITGLSKESLLRAEAMLGAGPDGEDAMLTKLKAQGGVSGSGIVKVIKTSLKSEWAGYQKSYNDASGPFRKFADELLSNEEKGLVSGFLQDSTLSRIKYGLDRQELEYVTLQLTAFASSEEKKAILADAALMGRIASSFDAREANKIRDLLIPANLSPEEKAKLLGDKIARESSFFMGASANADALDDEQRALAIALEKAKADGKLTPDEQKQIDGLNKSTESALSAYIGVRDDLNGYLEGALNLAASIAVSVATGGTAAAGMLAAQVARAALAQAIVSVAIKKIVLGDNFEVASPQAGGVFISGFVDGAMNAVGGTAAKSAISAALKDSARATALETGNVVFASSGRTVLTRVAEGVISNSPGAMVSTAVDDGTWKEGFAKGFGSVVSAGATAGAQGAALSVGAGAIADAKTAPAGASPSLDPNAPHAPGAPPEHTAGGKDIATAEKEIQQGKSHEFTDVLNGEHHVSTITDHGVEICSAKPCPIIGNRVTNRNAEIRRAQLAAGMDTAAIDTAVEALNGRAVALDQESIALNADIARWEADLKTYKDANPKQFPSIELRERQGVLQRAEQQINNRITELMEEVGGFEREQGARQVLHAEGFSTAPLGEADADVRKALKLTNKDAVADIVQRDPRSGRFVVAEGKGEDFGHATEQIGKTFDTIIANKAKLDKTLKPPVSATDFEFRIYTKQGSFEKLLAGEKIEKVYGIDADHFLTVDGVRYEYGKHAFLVVRGAN